VPPAISFTLTATDPDTRARAGVLTTPHGAVQTPVFMPVGTQGSVKAVHPQAMHGLGAQIVLGNAYHLYLRPGHQLIHRMGGLARWTTWDGPMLTDSGGFQVFSLAHTRKINDDGVRFRSHLDGSDHMLTPELTMEIEQALGADIAMVLDQPSAFPATRASTEEALGRTHRWAERCRRAHTRPDQALFPIVQGGFEADLRQESARMLVDMDFPGYAIGGLSVGEPKDVMWQMLQVTTSYLPAEKSRYLMGVGSPEDLLAGIALGVDMFDCSFPTRIARNGALLTPSGRVNIRNAQFKTAETPVLAGCDCDTCTRFTAAYVHHLFMAHELLAYQLASVHNLRFMVRLAQDARTAIIDGRFAAFRAGFDAGFRPADGAVQAAQKAKWLEARQRKGVRS